MSNRRLISGQWTNQLNMYSDDRNTWSGNRLGDARSYDCSRVLRERAYLVAGIGNQRGNC